MESLPSRANQLAEGGLSPVGFVIAVQFANEPPESLPQLVGSKWALGLDEVVLQRSFAVFLAVIATQMFFKK